MALKLQTGVQNLTEPDKKTGRYTPFFFWKDGDRKFLAFTTPADSIPKVLIHDFVKVPTGDDEKPFRNGVYFCRKDSAWADESGGECYVCDVLDLKPKVKYAAMAVELEPEFEGRNVSGLSIKYNKGQDEKEYPQTGLVLQSKKLFFSWLGAYNEARNDITEVSFEILRQGSNQDDTKYLFFDIKDRPDLSSIEEFIPNVADTLENLGTAEVYEALAASGAKAEDQTRFGPDKNKYSGAKQADNDVPTPASSDEFEKLSAELGLKPASS